MTITLSLSTCVFDHHYIYSFFNDTATTEIYTLSLHDALPIYLKNIWTAPLPPETELSRQMTTSTTSIDIMGLQAAYANLARKDRKAVQQECRDRSRMPSSA